ncbi:DNA-binding domain-containing protein [Natranaerofaba carboxydovora]|uniref:DNA-binding domain-containing protein n=1 Tax=Natranaerofaba carboxydovora TaxID=2742683 RepID=UPI001F134318|nr:DNA-binding domain-containing protein [Natranaerofaba carboxydovora]UMZ72715.1 Stage 0 sporulation protein A [Natranaerofaba carboxydovora]
MTNKPQWKFYIVDDDETICYSLTKIIETEQLGKIIGKANNGKEAMEELHEIKADVIIIDFLMPKLDGIQLVKNLKEKNYEGDFILLSQVTDKSIVKKAYTAGIEFYINKPIEKNEVVSVINKVLEKKNLQKMVSDIKTAITGNSYEPPTNYSSNISPFFSQNSEKHILEYTRETLVSLGIFNHAGSADIMEAMKILFNQQTDEVLKTLQNLKGLYEKISKNLYSKNDDLSKSDNLSKSKEAVERRVRRAIEYAFVNMAALGAEDPYHPKFERFSYNFFDFNELRYAMKKLSLGEKVSARVNVKKFLEGLYYDILKQLS